MTSAVQHASTVSTCVCRALTDNRFDYGEDRFHLLGQIDKRVFFVTYTLRAEVIRIISARKPTNER